MRAFKHFLCLVLLPTLASAAVSLRNEFRSSLVSRDMTKVHELYAQLLAEGKLPPELSAQYALFNCQLKQAIAESHNIQDEQMREAFKTVVYALASLPSDQILSPSETVVPLAPKRNSRKVNVPRLPKRSLGPKDEIWRDEWSDISYQSQCKRYPEIVQVEQRRKFLRLAQNTFQRLPSGDLRERIGPLMHFSESAHRVGLPQFQSTDVASLQGHQLELKTLVVRPTSLPVNGKIEVPVLVGP